MRGSKPSTFYSRRRKSVLSNWRQPTKFSATLKKPPLGVDPTSNQTAEQLPTYNAYSIDGDYHCTTGVYARTMATVRTTNKLIASEFQ